MSYCKNFIPWIAKCSDVGRYSWVAPLMSNILAKVSYGIVVKIL